jgi:hypothetical protein
VASVVFNQNGGYQAMVICLILVISLGLQARVRTGALLLINSAER